MARPEELSPQNAGNGQQQQHRLEDSSHLVENSSDQYEDEGITNEEDDEDESSLNPLARLLDWSSSSNFYDK